MENSSTPLFFFEDRHGDSEFDDLMKKYETPVNSGHHRKSEEEHVEQLKRFNVYLRSKLARQHRYFANELNLKDKKHREQVDGYLRREEKNMEKYELLKEDYRKLKQKYLALQKELHDLKSRHLVPGEQPRSSLPTPIFSMEPTTYAMHYPGYPNPPVHYQGHPTPAAHYPVHQTYHPTPAENYSRPRLPSPSPKVTKAPK